MRLLMCVVLIILAGCRSSPDDSIEGRAKNDMMIILTACKKYYAENGEWPIQLEDIADQLENGKKALIDPWGNKYMFSVESIPQANGTTNQRPIIWTVRTVNKTAKILVYPPDAKLTDEMKEDTTKEEIANNDVKVIELACKKFFAETGNWPAKLDDIAKSLENGKKALIDPWGKEYHFAIERLKQKDGTENQRPCIWSERTVNGVTRICGKKPTEEKKAEDPRDDSAKELAAKNDTKAINQALKKYYAENGNWPGKLADIADLLENGKKALIDPWGKEYKFQIAREKQKDGTVKQWPCVWAERTVAGKTSVYGTKPPEEKKK